MKQLASSFHLSRCVSHPARGAWIETRLYTTDGGMNKVAPREGCVD